jgi:glycosyltransferase involved in cell wall biosynthesis
MSPDLHGGVEVRTFQVGRALCSRGHRVSVLCAKTTPGFPEYEQIDGLEIHFAKTVPDFVLRRCKDPIYLAASLFHLLSPLYVIPFLRKNHVDLIRDSMSPVPALGLLACKTPWLRTPVVVVLHQLYDDLGHWCRYFGLIGGLSGYVFQEMLKRRKLIYEKVICDGRWVEDYLEPYLGDMLRHIPNGVDHSRFQICQPGDSSISSSNITILTVGRFVPQKGHEFLLKATHILKERDFPAKLVLAGDGPSFETMQQLARELDIQDMVEFLGQVSREDVPALLASADLFVLPSLVEGMPNTVLEAMAAGIPIVSTDISAVRGVLNFQNSVLVEPANEQALADGIQRLVEDQQLRARSVTLNRELVQTHYGWDRIATQEIAVFESVLASKGSSTDEK